MIDVTSLSCPQHSLVACGVCSFFHPSYCHYNCTIHFSCNLGCSLVAPSQCTFQSQTITFTPTTCPGGSGDPTPTIVQNTPQYTGPQLAAQTQNQGIGLEDLHRSSSAAAGLPTGSDSELLAVCAAILDAYTALHGQQVVHSDIHPRNLLLLPDGTARIIDFGVARIDAPDAGAAPRAGMGFFFEPEYARAVLARERIPKSSLRGEQYALGALLYYLISGAHYADFTFERDEMLRQIAEEAPLPLERRSAKVQGEIQDALFRALEKDPARRFDGTADFARAFREAAAEAEASKPVARASSGEFERFVDGVLAQVADPSAPFAYKGPGSPAISVTYGAAGIAYALHRIARARDDGGVLALADLWAEHAATRLDEDNAFYNDDVQITPETVGRISPFHTASGVAAVQAFLAQARGDAGALDQSMARFVELSSGRTDNLDLTLGRSSVLLTLSLLLDATAPAKPEALVSHGNEVSAGIWRELESEGALRGSSRVGYLGLAHGWAGLIVWSDALVAHSGVVAAGDGGAEAGRVGGSRRADAARRTMAGAGQDARPLHVRVVQRQRRVRAPLDLGSPRLWEAALPGAGGARGIGGIRFERRRARLVLRLGRTGVQPTGALSSHRRAEVAGPGGGACAAGG